MWRGNSAKNKIGSYEKGEWISKGGFNPSVDTVGGLSFERHPPGASQNQPILYPDIRRLGSDRQC